MSVPSPAKSPGAWDSCKLGSSTLPGLCVVSVKISDEIQKAKPKGKNGASTTFQGANLGTVKVTCTLHDLIDGTKDFDVAQDLLTSLNEKRGEPYEIVHPMPKLFGIRQVTIESVTGDLKGRDLVLVFEMSEFRQPKKGGEAVTKTTKTLDPRNQSLAPDLPVTPPAPSTSGGALP